MKQLSSYKVQIFSASCDSADTNQKFAARGTYPWPVLSDPDKKLAPDKAITDKDILAYRMLDISAGGSAIAASPG